MGGCRTPPHIHMPYTTNIKVLDAVSTTTTGAGFVVGDRVKLSIQFLCTGSATGIANAKVQVSNDGVNYFNYNRLISNVAAGTVVGTVNFDTTSGNSKSIYFFPAGDVFEYLRVQFNRNNQTSSAACTATLQTVIGD